MITFIKTLSFFTIFDNIKHKPYQNESFYKNIIKI